MDSTRFDRITGVFAQKQTRRAALRLLGLVAVGASGLGLLAAASIGTDAAARRKQRSGGPSAQTLVSQHEFVAICKKYGGKPASVATQVVKCTWGPGDTSTCNFDTRTCKEVLPYTSAR